MHDAIRERYTKVSKNNFSHNIWTFIILSKAKNLFFSISHEILHGVYPEPRSEIFYGACPDLNDETLRYLRVTRRRVQDDDFNYRVDKYISDEMEVILG